MAVGRSLMAARRVAVITGRVYALLSSLRRDGVAVVVFEQLSAQT